MRKALFEASHHGHKILRPEDSCICEFVPGSTQDIVRIMMQKCNCLALKLYILLMIHISTGNCTYFY